MRPAPSTVPVTPAGGRVLSLATVAFALLGLGLRLWHLDHGLPDLNEEAFPFRHALALWGAAGKPADWNPHWFVYPSLTIYLQHLVQQVFFRFSGSHSADDFLIRVATDPAPMLLAARSLGVLADAVTVVLVGRIAARAGLASATVAMGLVAFAPSMITTARLVYADSIMTAFSLAAVERLLAWFDLGGTRRLAAAAAFSGLAAGTKYPALVLLLPMLGTILARERGPRAVAMSAGAIGIAALAFMLTTPFLFVSWSEVVRDLTYIGDAQTGGSLGALGATSASHAFAIVRRNLGWAGCLALAGTIWSLARGPARSLLGLLAIACAAFFVPAALARVEAERYLIASVAFAACLVAIGIAPLFASASRRAGPLAVAALAIVFLLEPAAEGARAAMRGGGTTQLEARRWCEANLAAGDVVLSESYGPMLRTLRERAEMAASPIFQATGPRPRAQYLALPVYRIVVLPLLVGGHAAVQVPPGSPREVNVYPHAVDWNAAAYEPRFLRAVDVVVTTGAVRGRFEADPARFADQARFYAFLDRTAERLVQFTPNRNVEGPVITIYRLTAPARQALQRASALDTLWWTRTVPTTFRSLADSIMATEVPDVALIPGVPRWVQALRPAYDLRYRDFVLDLAENAAIAGRLDTARELVLADLTVAPEDLRAAKVYVDIAREQGSWNEVVPRLEWTMRAVLRTGPLPQELQLDYAEALLRSGHRARGERILDRLAKLAPAMKDTIRALRESTRPGNERRSDF